MFVSPATRPAGTRFRRCQGYVGLLVATVVIALAPAAASAASDTQAPSVAVTSPDSGSTVAGTVVLSATASDNVGVTEVRWYIDDKEIGRDTRAPYTRTWNSATRWPGSKEIYAKAVDAAGNWATSARLPFTSRSMKSWQVIQTEGFSGSAVNSDRWRVYGPWIPGHNGNGVRDGSAVKVANGFLTITARMVSGTLVSGGLSNRLDQKYGRYEFRVRTDADSTLTTSGVVLTWPQSQNWPVDGENDIYETTLDADRNPIKSFVHYGSSNNQYWFHHTGERGTAWHIMAMEWDPSAIRIYVDGMLRWTLTDTAAIPDVAHHMSIQLDAFKKSMSGSVRLQVDWVKISKRV